MSASIWNPATPYLVTGDDFIVLTAGTYSITVDTTYSLPVLALPGASVVVAAGVTLTFTAGFEAGFYPVFDVAATGLIKGLRTIYFEWFGAVGNATSPAIPILGEDLLTFNPVTDIPTGTDDSAAIRTAMRCAVNTEMMSNYLDPISWGSDNVGPGSHPFWPSQKLTAYPSKVLGRPGAGYLVSGDNLLGPQTEINGKLYFDGQGCSFEWLPANTNDSFIDKLDLIERPVLQNFNIRTWGFTGNRGRFIHTDDTKQFMNVLRGPLLHNINIDRGGYYNLTTDPLNVSVAGPVTGNALSKVLHIEGTNLCDTWELSHVQAWGYANFLTHSNPEAVAISFHNCDIASYYTGAVHFDVTTIFSGGMWWNNCQLGLLGSGQTWIRTRGSAASIGEYHVNNSRMETRYADYTIVDAEHGAFYMDGLNPNYGNPTASGSAYLAKLSKWVKTLQYSNGWAPQKIKLWAYTAANYATYSGNFEPIVIDCVTFPNGVPTIEWVNSNTLASVDIPALFTAFLRFRDIHFINSPQAYNACNSLLVTAPEQKRMIAFFDSSDGKTFIDDSGVAMPLGILITSIKVICDATGGAAVDRINIAFTSGPSYQAMISATDVTTTECIPTTKKGVCIVSDVGGRNIITADYYNGVGTPAAVRIPCRIVLTYRSLLGITDLNAASLDPTEV